MSVTLTGLARAGEKSEFCLGRNANGLLGLALAQENKEVRRFLGYVVIRFFFPSKVFASHPTAHHGPHLCVAVLPL
ncbi:hypothetical protein Q5P01_010082 [Channa striata]|uniref:Uncharacterized protein n=1 Tax=Channa striata TaxID=64152 RepID=A0AA88N0U5_CHASR|nr:hypothetical protein Q5P01_010082 [Channa striata]